MAHTFPQQRVPKKKHPNLLLCLCVCAFVVSIYLVLFIVFSFSIIFLGGRGFNIVSLSVSRLLSS